MLRQSLRQFRAEAPAVFTLAWPLVLAEIGWMAAGIVDTIMVGHMPNSAEAMGGVSLLYSLDTKVSQSFGAGDLRDANHSLLNALYILVPLTPALMFFIWLFGRMLPKMGINPAVLEQTLPFLTAMNWSTPPLLLYFAF